MAKDFNTKPYSDLDEMLERENLDAVCITTPPQIHREQAIRSMEAGCDVLVEKPFALSTGDAEEMLKVAERTGVRLCVVRNQLFDPGIPRALKLRKEMKDVIGFYGFFSFRRRVKESEKSWVNELPGGVMGEDLPHAIYLIRNFMGENPDPESVEAKYKDGELKATLHGDKVTGEIRASKNVPYNRMILVLGRNVSLVVDKENYIVSRHFLGKASIKSFLGNNLTILGDVFKGTVKQGFLYGSAKFFRSLGMERGYRTHPHYIQVDAFIRDLSGEGVPDFSGEDGLINVRIWEQIWKLAGEL